MKIINKVLTGLVLIAGVNSQALATPILSGDGTESCTYGTPLTTGTTPYSATNPNCTVQTISVHNLWQGNNPNNEGAQWISYADTGFSGGTLAPLAGTTSVFTVSESFTVNAGDVLNLDVWADDTSEVYLSLGNTQLYAPNFTQDICADGDIGCEPADKGVISYTFATAGAQVLNFDVFQVGTGTTNASNPFGLLYSGSITAVPEPTVLALIGFGLMGLGLTRRKIK